MNSRNLRLTLGLILTAVPVFLAGCSSNSNSSNLGNTPQTGSVAMMVSDASTEDWANIGVKILSISLIPQNGGSNVNVYTASAASAPMINLVQLDQLGEILENASVPVGTYTGAVVTISANPTDIQLIVLGGSFRGTSGSMQCDNDSTGEPDSGAGCNRHRPERDRHR